MPLLSSANAMMMLEKTKVNECVGLANSGDKNEVKDKNEKGIPNAKECGGVTIVNVHE